MSYTCLKLIPSAKDGLFHEVKNSPFFSGWTFWGDHMTINLGNPTNEDQHLINEEAEFIVTCDAFGLTSKAFALRVSEIARLQLGSSTEFVPFYTPPFPWMHPQAPASGRPPHITLFTWPGEVRLGFDSPPEGKGKPADSKDISEWVKLVTPIKVHCRICYVPDQPLTPEAE